MAKARKTRRAKVKRYQTVRRVSPAVMAPEAAVASQPKEANFAQEYKHVITDLRRIFVLAAVMLVVLVVLALVLR